jgi:SAM-dependent methyltransferase
VIHPRLYGELADWWPLFSPPSDYAEEAEFVRSALMAAGAKPSGTLLELGSGGGNNASYLKKHFQLTLVDISAPMLTISRELNPECDHIQGDMRTLRLGRAFDAVFVHDAIMYMTTARDLRQALETVFAHCRPRGAALIMPDFVRETFVNGSYHHGARDSGSRSLRKMEWTFDADPSDTVYTVDFACMLREGDGPVRVEHDCHTFGLFSRDDWKRLLAETGFTDVRIVSDPYGREIFTAKAG